MKNKINDKEILRLFWQVSVPYRRRRNLAIFFTITTIVISIFVGPLVIAELLNIIQHNQLQTANNLWTQLSYTVLASCVRWLLAGDWYRISPGRSRLHCNAIYTRDASTS